MLMRNNQNYPIGRVTVDQQFHTREADAAYLHFFGNAVIYSILRTIHDADVDTFCQTARALHIGERDHCVVRARNTDGFYQWMLVSVSACHDRDGTECFRLVFRDILRMESLLVESEQENSRHRHLLSLLRDFAFTYRFSTRQLEIFQFDCFRDIVLLRESLAAWQQLLQNEHLIDRGDLPTLAALCHDLETGTYRFQYEMEASFLNGGMRMEHLSVQGMTLWDAPEDGCVIGTISAIHPKSKTKDINLTLETNRDSLTDLLNKQAIVSYAKSLLGAPSRGMLSLILVDIDDFKDVNDRYGHLFGDEVLFSVGHIIKAEIGRRGMAGRIGGGIFQIIMEDIRDETDLRGILRAIRTKTEWAFAERGRGMKVTCSIGAAVSAPDSGSDYDALFMEADKALYIANAKGKNRYVIYDVALHGPVEPNRERSVADLYLNTPNRSKPDFIGELALRLSEQPIRVEQLLQEIGEQFGLDALHLYGAPIWKPVHSWGIPVKTPADFLFHDNFLSLFSADGVYVIDNVNSLEGCTNAALRHLTGENILGAVLYLIRKDDTPVGLLSCNLVNRFRKWATMDVNYLTILGRMVAGVYLRELDVP